MGGWISLNNSEYARDQMRIILGLKDQQTDSQCLIKSLAKWTMALESPKLTIYFL